MASEQYSGGMQAEEENTKPSFMNKVKSKAKKLKSKLKHHDSENSSGQAPAPRDPLDHYTTGSADQDGNESDTSSSSEETGNGNQHASEGTPFGAVSSGKTGYGMVSKTDDKSFPVDPSVLKSGGSAGTQEAIPTNYSYFNADPEQARLPSDIDSSGHQRDVLSTMGGLSTGSPAMQNFAGTDERDETLSKSSDRYSELPLSSVSREDSSERSDVGLVEPSQPSQDSLLSRPIDQNHGVSDKENEGYGGLVAATATGAGGAVAGMGHNFQKSLSNDAPKNLSSGMRRTSDPEAYDRSYVKSEGEGFAPNTTGTAASAKHAMDTNFNVPSQEPTWTQKIYNTVVGAKDTVASHPVTQSVVSHPVTEKAAETAYGLKETAASQLGYADQSLSSDSTPVSEKVIDSAVQAKDSAASNFSVNDEQKPFMDRVTETGYGIKDAVASHPITQTAASKLGYADQAMSTDFTPVSQKGTDSAYQVKNSASSNLSADDSAQQPLMNRLTESAYGMKDTVASHPVTQKAYGLKDTVVSHPVTQKATDYAVQGKNYAANQLSYADQALSSDDKPVSAKTYESAIQARDVAVQKTTPDHHDKALADSVTEAISSLPALLTTKLGLGGGTTNSPTTASTTPTANVSTFDPSTRKDTPFPDHSAAASPGIMDRVSGLASSLFGGAAKQPTTHTDSEKPASVENYIP